MPLQKYLFLLKTFGTFVQVGAPEDVLPSINAFQLIKGVNMTGSSIGSPAEIREMLQLAAEKGVKTWANPKAMSKVNEAVLEFEKGKPSKNLKSCNIV